MLGPFFGDRSYGTVSYALSAVGALGGDGSPDDPKPRSDGKKGSEGTEVTAPEPLSEKAEGKDRHEEEEDEEVHFEQGLAEGREKVRRFRKELLDFGQKGIVDEDRGRVENDDQGSGDETDGVEKVHDLKGH